MAQKTIKICDRCGAQFDMSDPRWENERLASRRNPLYKCTWSASNGMHAGDMHGEEFLCRPCRDDFTRLVREFFSGMNVAPQEDLSEPTAVLDSSIFVPRLLGYASRAVVVRTQRADMGWELVVNTKANELVYPTDNIPVYIDANDLQE